MLVCQVMCELSFVLTYNESVTDRPLLEVPMYLDLLFFLCCLYYGVDHFVHYKPKTLREVTPMLLRQSLAKALNRLGHRLTGSLDSIEPFKQKTLYVPSGCNVLQVKYYTEGNVDAHRGMPYDSTEVTLNVEVKVIGLKMLPVVSESYRSVYASKEGLEKCAAEYVVLPKFECEDLEEEPDFKLLKYRPGIDPVPIVPRKTVISPS